jgi:hypothetical protein
MGVHVLIVVDTYNIEGCGKPSCIRSTMEKDGKDNQKVREGWLNYKPNAHPKART